MDAPAPNLGPLKDLIVAGEGEDQRWIFALVRARVELEAYYRAVDRQSTGSSSWMGILLDRMRDGISPRTVFARPESFDAPWNRDEALLERVGSRLACISPTAQDTLAKALRYAASEALTAAFGDLALLVARLPEVGKAYRQAVAKHRRKQKDGADDSAPSFEAWICARARSTDPGTRATVHRFRALAQVSFQHALAEYAALVSAEAAPQRHPRDLRARLETQPAAPDRVEDASLPSSAVQGNQEAAEGRSC